MQISAVATPNRDKPKEKEEKAAVLLLNFISIICSQVRLLFFAS